MSTPSDGKAQVVSDDTLQERLFDAAVGKIDDAFFRKDLRLTRRRLKRLMDQLLERPSKITIRLFILMHKRWWPYYDAIGYLQDHWEPWVTWEDRLEIIRVKHDSD